jgi:hypothetical protein
MNVKRSHLFTSAVVGALALVGLAPPAFAAPVVYDYEMNEPAGASVMLDSGASHWNGVIGSEVSTGVTVLGATGYSFPRLTPNTPPAHPQHLVHIPDSDALDPGGSNFAVEIRYRTTNDFGNLIQKGQATTPGGQFKIQLPGGKVQCYYKGTLGRVGVGYGVSLRDGNWHTLRCTRTGNLVELFVDGVRRDHKSGSIGTLSNAYDWTVGGKSNCDQIKVTCDYFGGTVDYVKLTKG